MSEFDFEVVFNTDEIPSLDYYEQIADQADKNVKEITRAHWVNNEAHPNCWNKACRKKFSLIDRVHHCRRCGNVFCKDCSQYKRRLTYLAAPDPGGHLYKVCVSCFEVGRDYECCSRRWTKEFRDCRRQYQARGHVSSTGPNNKLGIITSWRDKLDLQRECQRLVDGFRQKIGSSEVKRTLLEMKTIVKTPEWQKAKFWLQENMTEKCQKCRKSFGLIQKKVNCKLCAMVLCKSCSKHELLVFIPDDGGSNPTPDCQPELAIIRIVGSPEVEPELSILLHVCESCRQYLVDRQISEAERALKADIPDTSVTVLTKLISLDNSVSGIQNKMTYQLNKYQEIVESLEDSSRSSGYSSNTKVLAKAQEDLSDFLATYILKIQVVKKLQSLADTDTQRTVFRNYLMAKVEFYMDSMHTFRSSKRKLGESAPPEILEYIQKMVDKMTIVSAQVYIRQLIFETMLLCGKHSLPDKLPSLLTPLYQVIEDDVRSCLQAMKENVDEHEETVKELIKSQINEHRLIKPSKRITASIGTKHVRDLMVERTQEILEQISIQLALKSINRSFTTTKKALETAKDEVLVS